MRFPYRTTLQYLIWRSYYGQLGRGIPILTMAFVVLPLSNPSTRNRKPVKTCIRRIFGDLSVWRQATSHGIYSKEIGRQRVDGSEVFTPGLGAADFEVTTTGYQGVQSTSNIVGGSVSRSSLCWLGSFQYLNSARIKRSVLCGRRGLGLVHCIGRPHDINKEVPWVPIRLAQT